MKLNYQPREKTTKGAVAAMRRAGKIPAIIYKRGADGELISVDLAEYEALLRSITPGTLSTKVIELVGHGGKVRKALVKDIHYRGTNYNVLHLDFEELHEGTPVTVRVPIEYTGGNECKGVKLGGYLRPVIRSIRVRCQPKDIPSHFEIDVRDLEIKQTARLSAIKFPEGMSSKARLNEVAVIVAKK